MSEGYEYALKSFEAEAGEVLRRAREAARTILKSALAEADRLKAQARAEGLAQGLKQGAEQGSAASQKRVAEETRTLAAALAAATSQIARRRAELMHLARRDLTELALAAAERIVRARIQVDPAVAARAAEAAILTAGQRRALEVRLNPADLAAMTPPEAEGVRFVGDPAVERGGAAVRLLNAEIDAQVATQLDALKEAVLG